MELPASNTDSEQETLVGFKVQIKKILKQNSADVETSTTTYFCLVCKKQFGQSSHLAALHSRTHEDEKAPKPGEQEQLSNELQVSIGCKIEIKSKKKKPKLFYMYTIENSYFCLVCGKQFEESLSLAMKHCITHNEEKLQINGKEVPLTTDNQNQMLAQSKANTQNSAKKNKRGAPFIDIIKIAYFCLECKKDLGESIILATEHSITHDEERTRNGDNPEMSSNKEGPDNSAGEQQEILVGCRKDNLKTVIKKKLVDTIKDTYFCLLCNNQFGESLKDATNHTLSSYEDEKNPKIVDKYQAVNRYWEILLINSNKLENILGCKVRFQKIYRMKKNTLKIWQNDNSKGKSLACENSISTLGTEQSLAAHEENKQEKNVEIRKSKKAKKKDKSKSNRVTEQSSQANFKPLKSQNSSKDLINFIQLANKYKSMHIDQIKRDLRQLMLKILPNKMVNLYEHGSRVYGIATRKSDLNIYIEIDRTESDFKNDLLSVREDLKAIGRKTCNFTRMKDNNNDKCQVKHIPTNVMCTLSFSNILATTNSILLEYLLNLQPIARIMCIYIRQRFWSASIAKFFNGYALCLMVIFYMQTLHQLPSIEKLQRNLNPTNLVEVGPWIASYVPHEQESLDITELDYTYNSCIQLIQGFFDFYIHFNYATEVICPYLGHSIHKTDFKQMMPHRYISYVEESEINQDLDLSNAVTIQDPIQLNCNVLKDFSSSNLEAFQKALKRTLARMSRK